MDVEITLKFGSLSLRATHCSPETLCERPTRDCLLLDWLVKWQALSKVAAHYLLQSNVSGFQVSSIFVHASI